MKKITAVWLITLVLFNSIGYYGLYLVGLRELDRRMSTELDESRYSGHDVMIAKIPMTLPYQANFDGYERVDGQFESEGHFYKIFQQKVVKDTLYVVFVENKRSGELHKSIANFAAASGTDSPAKLIMNFCQDFVATHIVMQIGARGWERKLSLTTSVAPTLVPNHKFFSPPPDTE